MTSRAADLQHPVMSEAAGVVVLERRTSDGFRLAFRALAGGGGQTLLPAIVNATGFEVTRPQFSADGRYLAFVRGAVAGRPS
jgi:hypothetical protein